MMTNSNLWLSDFKPLDKLWPVPSPVTYPDKPCFQVPSCTPWHFPTNPEFCHMSLSHALITSLGLPDIYGSQNLSSPNPESLTQPPMNLSRTSLNFSRTSSSDFIKP